MELFLISAARGKFVHKVTVFLFYFLHCILLFLVSFMNGIWIIIDYFRCFCFCFLRATINSKISAVNPNIFSVNTNIPKVLFPFPASTH